MPCKTCSFLSYRSWWLPALAASALAAAALALWPSQRVAATTVGAPTVQRLDGTSVELRALTSGKPTLLIFWATWCPTCRAEVPDFAGAYRRYAPKGLQVLAVDVGYNDPIEDVRQFSKARALPYTVLYDAHQEAVRAYRVAGTPTALLLAPDGAAVSRGFRVDDKAIQALLNGQSSAKNHAEPRPERPVAQKLEALADESAAKMPANIRADIAAGLREMADSGLSRHALQAGAPMPAFSLKDARGRPVSSRDLLEEGPLVIVFYRGAWCPFCNLYLASLQEVLPRFAELGATLVAISPESPGKSLSVKEKNALTFTVLSDPGMKVARKFGIVYPLPEVMEGAYRKMGLNVKEYYNSGGAELPLSATYVVDQRGKVAYAFLDPNYKHRAEPADILAVLERLQGKGSP